MAELLLVTGGLRSGKSTHALQRAEALAGARVFIATCPIVDDEIAERIRRHRDERAGRGWETIEEQVDLAAALSTTHAPVVLVDCLTLWVSNLMHVSVEELQEEDVASRCEELLQAGKGRQGTIIIVTNEVGSGIVPDNALACRYRDLLGRANQLIAAAADEVVFMVSGIPSRIK